MHVRSSQDAGQKWTPNDIWLVNGAINPALAINNKGVVGFLYQRLDSSKPQERWKTELIFAGKPPIILADTPADVPKVSSWQPYLGDYLNLLAIGADFFGVFSANNTSVPDFFPAKMPLYNRNCKGKALVGKDGSSPIPPSIDPFFFHISDLPEGAKNE